MRIFAIGDLQGCFAPFERLLESIDFQPGSDCLWLTGDIVNRGPESLQTLRFVKNLGSSAVTVLGNHDLHLLAVAASHGSLKRQDTLQPILDAPDRDELLDWLRHQPLLHYDPITNVVLTHAGIYPAWDLTAAQARAIEVENVLRGDNAAEFFAHMYGNHPDAWRDDLEGWPRLRFITNCFTRMRYCDKNHVLDMKPKGPPGSQNSHLVPWFEAPNRALTDIPILFGHWSTLGNVHENNVIALDTGCLWGGKLTAVELTANPFRYIQVVCEESMRPGPGL